MKTQSLVSLLAVAAISAAAMFTQTSCLSTSAAQYASDAFYVAGAEFAVSKLSDNPAAGQVLDHFAAALPNIPLGKVSAFDLGVLSGELDALKQAKSEQASTRAESAAFDKIITLVGTASVILNKGGNPTLITGAISAQAQSFSNGIVYGRQFNAGKRSVSVPPTVEAQKRELVSKQAAAHG